MNEQDLYNGLGNSVNNGWEYDFEREMEYMNELEQVQQGLAITEQAKSFIISNQQDYNNAAEICKDIKAKIKTIQDYWKDLKDKAYKAWKDICAKESDLLAPYTKAEGEIKGKMTEFQRQKMEEKRILREEQERFRKEEAERLMKAAEEAQSSGETEQADYLVEEAAKAETMEFKPFKQEKTAGTAVKKIWKARVTNESIVPVSIMGTVIRPVDLSALDKLAKFSKGQTQVPGVDFYEDVQIAVSRG